jgi:hypothetical protein
MNVSRMLYAPCGSNKTRKRRKRRRRRRRRDIQKHAFLFRL